MYSNEKIWSIELGDDLEISGSDRKHRGTTSHGSETRDQARLVVRRKTREPGRIGKNPPRRLHFALLLPLTFLLGPFAIHLTPEGRGRKEWAVTGMIAGTGWLALAAAWPFLLRWLERGTATGPILVTVATLIVAGFTVWARAVHLAGGANRPADHLLPLPLRRAWGTGFLGFLAPGAGLLAAGRNRRAAAALWLAWIPLTSLLVLALGPRLHAARGGAIDASWERILLAAAALAAAGVVGWLLQALEGARLVPWEGQRYSRHRSDLLGLAAVAGVLAMVALVDPTPVARSLGRNARTLHAEGYHLVPLAMLRTAETLDPGRTDYAVVAMEIYEELGRADRAAAVRGRLERDLASYLEMKRREDAPAPEADQAEGPVDGKWPPTLATQPFGWFSPADPWTKKDPGEKSPGSGSR